MAGKQHVTLSWALRQYETWNYYFFYSTKIYCVFTTFQPLCEALRIPWRANVDIVPLKWFTVYQTLLRTLPDWGEIGIVDNSILQIKKLKPRARPGNLSVTQGGGVQSYTHMVGILAPNLGPFQFYTNSNTDICFMLGRDKALSLTQFQLVYNNSVMWVLLLLLLITIIIVSIVHWWNWPRGMVACPRSPR